MHWSGLNENDNKTKIRGPRHKLAKEKAKLNKDNIRYHVENIITFEKVRIWGGDDWGGGACPSQYFKSRSPISEWGCAEAGLVVTAITQRTHAPVYRSGLIGPVLACVKLVRSTTATLYKYLMNFTTGQNSLLLRFSKFLCHFTRLASILTCLINR